MAMLVATDVAWMLPCTEMVELDDARTLPDVCWLGAACPDNRFSNSVPVPLNAVVCEFAILPDMFCNAKDCACSPLTAVFRASKIPMTRGLPSGAGGRQELAAASTCDDVIANPVPNESLLWFNGLAENAR